jgi:hypothetical protein
LYTLRVIDNEYKEVLIISRLYMFLLCCTQFYWGTQEILLPIMQPGCFRVGNTGGMLDNIVSSKLYRAGSVAYVSKSGGMSNELNNMICRNSDGVY